MKKLQRKNQKETKTDLTQLSVLLHQKTKTERDSECLYKKLLQFYLA